MKSNAVCGFEYHRLSGANLPAFATKIMDGVWDHPLTFDPLVNPPPSTKSVFLLAINAAQGSYSSYDMGGKAQKPAFDDDYNLLIELIDKYNAFVNKVADGVANVIIISGFTPVHSVPNVKEVAPGQPTSVTIFNGSVSGILNSECESFGTNHHYGCIACEGHPLPDGIQILLTGILVMPSNVTFRIFHHFTHSRKKVITGLTKGIEYYFYYYVTNTAGVSVLSVVVSKMCS